MRTIKYLHHLIWSFTLFAAFSVHAQSSSDLLPRPAALEPAIKFWTRVYTEVDTQSGFLHDAENLSVVYRRVDYNREQIEHYRGRIHEDLQVLASGKRTGLTLHQQQVLDAWPEGVSNTTLAEAVNRVRFQLGQSDRFIEGLIRSGAYREHIERVTRERGLPVELAALPHVESSFHPGAYSHAAAAGMWQFMRATGQRFMRIDNVVDERMDPYTATYAAMSLLEYNYGLLGKWPLALTAYNHGAGGIARAVRETGSDNIEDIIANYRGRAFGFASRNFYPQFLAVLDVERQAQALFGVLHLDSAPQYEEYELQAYIEADVLAQRLGVTIEQLRFDNPALRPVVWQGGKRIPRGYTLKIQRNSINGDLASLIESVPDTQLYAYQTPDVNYVVQRGDSLSVIARRFDTSVRELVSLNQLRDQHRISVGQTLLLPHDTDMVTRTLASVDEPVDSPVDEPEPQLVAVSFSDTDEGPQLSDAATVSVAAVEQSAAEMVAVTEPAPFYGPPEPPSLSITGVDADQPAIEVVENVQVSNELAELDLAADPSDYSVAADGTIEIQASETLGHFAEWLDVRAQDLRRINGMSFNQPLIVGNRLRLSLDQVSRDEFELRRRQFHIAQQERFFRNYRIQDLNQHQLAANETIDTLARRRYSIPLWLLRQYNPDLDLGRVRVGQTILVPIVEPVNDV
ncbi:LysM peptidoglycan-binding domain-containing protein [Pseudohongiella spirulinae]|uniref:Lytic transglycosylase catalytic n=1 Tax=Pseudohongiella spirulinae TaxID=1249552 RepID=A0A0S2KBI8_9GAMM|nr:LysM peptidoglycan-binding domain-containing protein [Pseudohongiella spirulinae]ALO45692.1 Lytic transglycosylase catalytic [Pseudohongiella spirulinae]